MKATIDVNTGICTFINMFHPKAGNQDVVIDLIAKANDEVMCKLPGYINSNIHKSDDGAMVVNYVQWESKQSFMRIFENPRAIEHMKAITPLVERSERHFFDVVKVQLPKPEAGHADR